MDKAKYIELIKGKMSEYRFVHSINVSKAAVELAKRYNADIENAEIAGVLHDICKEMPQDEMLQIINDGGIILDDCEKNSSKLWHSIAGSCYVRDVLNIKNEDIINAIKYHTTGRANMSLLEKIIFTADYISEERTFDGVDIMRQKAFENIEDAMLFALQFTLSDLSKRKMVIHNNAVLCYNDVVMNLSKKGLL